MPYFVLSAFFKFYDLIILLMKSEAKAGLELGCLSVFSYKGSVLGGDGDFLIFLITTTFDFSPFYKFFIWFKRPLTGLTLIYEAFASEFLGPSGDIDFFLSTLRTLLLSEIFFKFGFSLPSPLELTIGYALGFRFIKFAFKILRF